MEEPAHPAAAPPAGLHSLGGEVAPATLSDDLRHLSTLPDSVQQSLWEIVEPSLGPTVDRRVELQVADYCQRHGVAMSELAPVVRGCRLLFLQAAERDLALELMAQDLRQLCDNPSVARTILSVYRRALPQLRAQRLLQTLGDFGPVLEDVKLRLDLVPTSRHSGQGMGIALLSLGYREDNERKRLTVQVPAPLLAQLKAALEGLGK